MSDGAAAGGGQFGRFREFQRQAAAAVEGPGAAAASGGSGGGGGGGGGPRSGGAAAGGRGQQGADPRRPPAQRRRPYSKRYWRQLPNSWFARPELTPAALYEELLVRCERNTCDVDALYMVCKLAASPQEARIALSAFAAVRASLVRRGKVAPFNARLGVAFVEMIRAADAPDVLVDALRRSAELGLLLSTTRVHALLAHWGAAGELAKIEQVLGAMPAGGVPYTNVTAYILIRTAVTLGAQDKAEYYAQAMLQRQIRLTGTTQRLLQLGRERQQQQLAEQQMQMQMQMQVQMQMQAAAAAAADEAQ